MLISEMFDLKINEIHIDKRKGVTINQIVLVLSR